MRRLTVVDVPTPVDPLTHVSIPKAFNARNAKSRRDLAATVRVKVPHEPPPSRKARADTAARTSGSASCAARCGRTPATSAPSVRTTRVGPSGGGGCAARPRHPAQGRRAHQLGGPHLRPDLRPARRAGLPVRRRHRGDRLRADPAPALHRARPAHGGVPAARRVAPPRRRRARRGRLDAGPRAPSRRGRALPADAGRRRLRRLHPDGPAVERAGGPRAGPGLPVSAEPDGGMAWMLHRWASGQRLDMVLKDSEMAAGDFVRRCKQIVDLLGQIGDAAPQPALAPPPARRSTPSCAASSPRTGSTDPRDRPRAPAGHSPRTSATSTRLNDEARP